MARAKKSTTTETVEVIEDVKETKETVEDVKKTKNVVNEVKKFAPDDTILCKSVCAGKLLYEGRKSKIVYEFSNIGDTEYVEFQDLRASALSKADMLYKPYIMIDDEDVLKDKAFSKLNELYENLYDDEDIEILLDMPTKKFEKELKLIPVGMRSTVATIISTRIREGSFDSYNKAKIVDDLCGTDLCLLLQG